jgi:isoquinoline 1-oxidoreductase subunit beta
MSKLTRRLFIGTGVAAVGGLAVGTAWLSRIDLRGVDSSGPRGAAQRLNAFIEVLPDGSVRVLAARAEMGQGAQMGLSTLVAEELDVPLSRIQAVHPSELLPAYMNTLLAVGKRPEEVAGPLQWTAQRVFSTFPYIGTGGSTTLADAWVPVRAAAATARVMLLQAAAARWQVPVDQLSHADGVVQHPASQRQAHYGELAADAAKLTPPAAPALKQPAQYKHIGRDGQQRVDLPAKVTGAAVFGVDVKLPGLRVGTLLHAPRFGAVLASVDDSAIKGLPGQVQIVKGKHYVAAVATSYWFAKQALAALKIEWSGGAITSSAEVRSTLQAALQGKAGDAKEFRSEG